MPASSRSILIIEDDSRISRTIRDALELAITNIRVEIAGSPARARTICEKFPPTCIIWDGAPNERGTEQQYVDCVPETLWKRVVPISIDAGILEIAQSRGAMAAIPKRPEGINSWADDLAERVRGLLTKSKK